VAFDVGVIEIGEGANKRRIHVMNEHIAVEDVDGKRIATYPDVITTLDTDGDPLSAGKVREGMEVLIFHVPKNLIPLSSSISDPAVYPPVEKALGINISNYALGKEHA
jgi:uncharacterized protein